MYASSYHEFVDFDGYALFLSVIMNKPTPFGPVKNIDMISYCVII